MWWSRREAPVDPTTSQGGCAAVTEQPRWPRERTRVRSRHAAARWDPERPSEDLPSLGVTIVLTLVGLGLLGVVAWIDPLIAATLAGTLLLWSLGVEVTGNTVSTRVHSPARRVLWVLLRPAYVLGFVVWAVLEALLELVLG
jgi:hypothetical protein